MVMREVQDEEIFDYLAWFFRDMKEGFRFYKKNLEVFEDIFVEEDWGFDKIYQGVARGKFFNKHAWKKNQKGEIIV